MNMTPEEEVANYIEMIERERGYPVGAEAGLHLQSWLENQVTENSGCVMIDSVFVSEEL